MTARPWTEAEDRVVRHAWTTAETSAFCDALADGASISIAANAAGKSKGAGISRLRKICNAMGAQAV